MTGRLPLSLAVVVSLATLAQYHPAPGWYLASLALFAWWLRASVVAARR